jgi:hypothetical protein
MKVMRSAREIAFDAGGTTPGSAPIATYEFWFGDGTSISGPSSTVTHSYTTTGVSLWVLVRVTDTLGHFAETSILVPIPAPVKTAPCPPAACGRHRVPAVV